VLGFELEDWSEDVKTASFKIKAESGTYIKELVTGDDGRTKPSISDVLKMKCIVVSLDVMQVHDDELI
jgi:tRNA pseudouridine synthase 10